MKQVVCMATNRIVAPSTPEGDGPTLLIPAAEVILVLSSREWIRKDGKMEAAESFETVRFVADQSGLANIIRDFVMILSDIDCTAQIMEENGVDIERGDFLEQLKGILAAVTTAGEEAKKKEES